MKNDTRSLGGGLAVALLMTLFILGLKLCRNAGASEIPAADTVAVAVRDTAQKHPKRPKTKRARKSSQPLSKSPRTAPRDYSLTPEQESPVTEE